MQYLSEYVMKQLDNITKDHIPMHTISFKYKMAIFFSFLVV